LKAERLPKEEFDRLPETPVEILPFDAESKKQAYLYLDRLNEILKPHKVSAEFFGSVELEIAGKGEWEFAIWLDDANWYSMMTTLINHYKSIWFLDEEMAVFNITDEANRIEVIPMRGNAALRNKAVMAYWRNHPDKLKEYEQFKFEFSSSKREYYRWKHNYIGDIIDSLKKVE